MPFQIPFQAKWKYVNIHKSAYIHIINIIPIALRLVLYIYYILYILHIYYYYIYYLPFHGAQILAKRGLKIWHETDYFSYLMKCSEQKSKGKGAHKFLIFKHFCNNLGAINYLGTKYTFKNFRVFQ